MKSPRHFLLLAGLALLALVPPARSQNSVPPAATLATLASSNIVVPADTTIPLSLRNTISSRTASVGQAIYCETIYPITVGNRMVIPSGSYVKGSVTQVIRPGRVKGKAQIGLRFDSITLANGATRPLRATLSGYAGNGNEGFRKEESKIEGESSKGKDAGTVVSSTVTGAEIGGIAGVAKHSIGKGLGIGSAAGAAGGLIWVLASRGKEILLPAGTNLELQLSAPLTFQDDQIESSSPYQNGPALPRREPNH